MKNKTLAKLVARREKLLRRIKLINFDLFLVHRKFNKIVTKCKHYSYDSDAFEEYCSLQRGNEGSDFKSSALCAKCKHWEAKEK